MEGGSSTVGQQLRDIRHHRDLTLQQVAEAAGLSKSYISQMENDKANPSLSSLKAVMQVYGLPLAALFDGTRGQPRHVVRRGDRRSFSHLASRIRYELLAPDIDRCMEPLLCTAEPGAVSRQRRFVHEGEEFGMILHGKLRLVVGEEEYLLEEGDCVYFDSRIPHDWEAIGDTQMQSIWVISPPSF